MRTGRLRRALVTACSLALVLVGASCTTPRAREPGRGADPTDGLLRVERARDGDCEDTGACAGPGYVFDGRRYWVACELVPPEWLGGPLVAVGYQDVPFDEVRALPGVDLAARVVARQRGRSYPCEGEAGQWLALYVPAPFRAAGGERRAPVVTGDGPSGPERPGVR